MDPIPTGNPLIDEYFPSSTDDELLERGRKGDPEATLAWYRRQGQRSPFFFSRVIAGYGELTAELHAPICHWFVSSEAERGRGLLMPRKYFKSSMLKGYVERALTQHRGTERRFLFVGENEDVGAKNVTDIQWKLREDRMFQALYPWLIPADRGREWPASALSLPRSRSYDEPTIQSIGIGTKHTGFHYTDMVYDDPIGWVAAHSAMEMQKAIEWFKAAPGLLDSTEALELYIGTRWKHGAADLPGWIMKELPYRVVDHRRDGYSWIVRDAIENGRSIFPPVTAASGKRVGYSIPDLMAMKKRMGTYLFNANMRNNPTAGEDTDFPEAWVKKYRIAEDRRGVILLDTMERVEARGLVRVTVFDPSSGGKSAAAENAIVVIGCDRKGRILVLDRWAKNCSFGQAVEHWHVMNDKWKCWRHWYEAVGAHKEVGEKFKERPDYQGTAVPCPYCTKVHLKMRPRAILPPPGPKEDRIRELAQPAFEEGRVYIGEHHTDLERQILDFPHGELVDLFDALAYAIQKARKPLLADDERTPPQAVLDRRRTPQPRTHSARDYGGYS